MSSLFSDFNGNSYQHLGKVSGCKFPCCACGASDPTEKYRLTYFNGKFEQLVAVCADCHHQTYDESVKDFSNKLESQMAIEFSLENLEAHSRWTIGEREYEEHKHDGWMVDFA